MKVTPIHPFHSLTGLTKKEQARYRAIVRELSQLPLNGVTHVGYQLLEKELRALNRKIEESKR